MAKKQKETEPSSILVCQQRNTDEEKGTIELSCAPFVRIEDAEISEEKPKKNIR